MSDNRGQMPDAAILVNGSTLPNDAAGHLLEVTVDEDVAVPSMFLLRFAEGDDVADGFRWVDDAGLFSVGNAVEIRLGYFGALATLMKGEITALEPEFAADRRPSLTVRGYDRRHRLQRGRKTRTFLKEKDSAIAEQVGAAAGLSVNATDTAVTHEYVVQNNLTDLELLQERAALLDYEVVVEDKTLFFRPAGNSKDAVLTLTLYDDLTEFSPRLSTRGLVTGVVVRGWDPVKKEVIEGKAGGSDLVSRMGGAQSGAALVQAAFGEAALVEVEHPVMSQAEADAVARGVFNRNALELIVGDGACAGAPDLRAGTVIALHGLGARFSGAYYVTRAVHRFTVDGYETRFQVRRTAL